MGYGTTPSQSTKCFIRSTVLEMFYVVTSATVIVVYIWLLLMVEGERSDWGESRFLLFCWIKNNTVLRREKEWVSKGSFCARWETFDHWDVGNIIPAIPIVYYCSLYYKNMRILGDEIPNIWEAEFPPSLLCSPYVITMEMSLLLCSLHSGYLPQNISGEKIWTLIVSHAADLQSNRSAILCVFWASNVDTHLWIQIHSMHFQFEGFHRCSMGCKCVQPTYYLSVH